MDEILFTSSSLIDLLSQIEELKDVDVGIVETPDGDIQLQVGESTYSIDTNNADIVEVSSDVVDEISDINEEAYSELSSNSELSITEDSDVINSGIIKEIAKTLLVGGLVRLTGKVIKKWEVAWYYET